MLTEFFGNLPSGQSARLYTITCGALTAKITDFGAALVSLWVPDQTGKTADIVLGYDDCRGYANGTAFLGATVGRNANRIRNGTFSIGTRTVHLAANEGCHNLHSGPNFYHTRLWAVEQHCADRITLLLESPDGDQGFPGNASIRVCYCLEAPDTLRISYRAVSDQDTVFNLTNHSYFNLAGHQNQSLAMQQTLWLPARYFVKNTLTGELLPVDGTPLDFREARPLCQDITADFLTPQNGYDHCFAICETPCAILRDPSSGRTMEISTDCPGLQVYTANFTDTVGKSGIHYRPHCAVALETQFFPDAVNHPAWRQPFFAAGQIYTSETRCRFR